MDLVLEHIAKTYPGGAEILSDVNLTVPHGELLVLVGPSGCGKTTTLRMIAGLETPSRGTIRLGNRVVNDIPAYERNVGMAFQRPALYPHRTVRDNLLFSTNLRHPWRRLWHRLTRRPGESYHADEVTQVARTVGVTDLLDRLPPQLSGGEQQRVALGRALMRRPAVLLLDEPLGHLDPPVRLDLRRQLHLLHSRLPATMIHVTHDPVEALTHGDRVAVLDGGVIQQVDRPDIIVRRPASRCVAALMCQRLGPMNFLDGRLAGSDANVVLVTSGQELLVPADMARNWLPFRGQEVSVGLGPENIAVFASNPGTGVIRGAVILIESNRDKVLVTCVALGRDITAQVAGSLTAGQEVFLNVDWTQAMLFDRKSGRTLSIPTG